MTHIITCKVENIGGAQLVEFAPKGESVTIGGPNRAGKSSAINALIAALGGKSNLPADPVRHGAEAGKVEIELTNFKVFLDVQPDRTSKLRVETKEGARFSSPQAMLDALFGGLSFNPGAFRLMEDKKRKAVLMQLTKIDFTDLEGYEKEWVEKRAYHKKRAAELEAIAKSIPENPNAPKSAPDLASMTKNYMEMVDHNAMTDQWATAIDARRSQIVEYKEKRDHLKSQLEKIESMIATFERDLNTELAKTSPVKYDVAPVLAQINGCKEQMVAFEKQQQRKKVIEDAQSQKAVVALAEQHLTGARDERAKRLAAATFPIEGLGFSDGDVTYNGIPFAQLSESEQWEISTAIGFALNQKGIVFMANCGGLDSKARDRVRQRAAEAGVQLFLEVVDDQKDVQIVIEDGTVKLDRTKEQSGNAS